jgi:hypothetical protein
MHRSQSCADRLVKTSYLNCNLTLAGPADRPGLPAARQDSTFSDEPWIRALLVPERMARRRRSGAGGAHGGRTRARVGGRKRVRVRTHAAEVALAKTARGRAAHRRRRADSGDHAVDRAGITLWMIIPENTKVPVDADRNRRTEFTRPQPSVKVRAAAVSRLFPSVHGSGRAVPACVPTARRPIPISGARPGSVLGEFVRLRWAQGESVQRQAWVCAGADRTLGRLWLLRCAAWRRRCAVSPRQRSE